ncbi:MAG: hypothetical protein RR356_03025 [Bacteroidales bacterium]
MENFEHISDFLEKTGHQTINKVKKNKTKPISMILIAVICIVLTISNIIKVDYIPFLMIIIAIALLSIGAVSLYRMMKINQHDYIYLPTGKKFKKYIIYLKSMDAQKLITAIGTRNYTLLDSIKKEINSGHYLEVYGPEGGTFYLAQVKEYIPHNFEPASPIAIVEGNDARIIENFIHKK